MSKFQKMQVVLLVACTTLTLVAACGESSPTPVANPTTAAVTTAPVTTAQTANTTNAATTAPVTTPATSSVAQTATTAPKTTSAPTAPPATATPLPANRPVSNGYPAGPAPTAAAPQGGLVETTLQVPDALRKGDWTTPRKVQLPPGFSISLYSKLDAAVRLGSFSPDGRLFVAVRGANQIVFLKDNNGVGEPVVFAEGLNGPHNLVFHSINGEMFLWVAENDKISRYTYQAGQNKAGDKKVIVPNLPVGGGHSTRTLAFGPDGKLYVAAGSSCNVCEENDERRAAVTRYNPDGSGQEIFARGLRNEVGILFHPQTGELWGVENSRDDLGNSTEENNNIPPEEINIIKEGSHYGWPYCYSNQVWDKKYGAKNADFCKQTIVPALPMQAHSAPLGLDFYLPQTMQFPPDYKGDVFVAFHGSWNSSPATGYKVVRVRVKDGRPVSYENFAVGWLTGPAGRSNSWGRPVAPIVAPDGSLYVTDDSSNVIYKITYNRL